MEKQKLEWQSVAIPKPLVKRIKAIYVLCGALSVAEYIRTRVMQAVWIDETKLQIEKEQREDQ
jgi:hypothetical protein